VEVVIAPDALTTPANADNCQSEAVLQKKPPRNKQRSSHALKQRGALVSAARRLITAVERERQDARRIAEDLAIAVVMTSSLRRLHEDAKLVLVDGNLAIERGHALALRVLEPSPTKTSRRAKTRGPK
jgi:hypothetical protein